ncbi:MAG: hypothetical protein AAGC57_20235 [Pseudomonadota bacterium]
MLDVTERSGGDGDGEPCPELTPWGRLVQEWCVKNHVLTAHLAQRLGLRPSELCALQRGRAELTDELAIRITAVMYPAGFTVAQMTGDEP